MHRSRKVKFWHIFIVDEGREDQNTSKRGLSSARQLNTIEMVFRWRADDGPIFNAGF